MFIVQEAEGAKRRWDLKPGVRLTVGRSQESNIKIDDIRVSRYHALIRWVSFTEAEVVNVSGNIVLVNGVTLDGENQSRTLQHGDEITIVNAVLRVKWADEDSVSEQMNYVDDPLSRDTIITPAPAHPASLLSTPAPQKRSKDDEINELRRKAEVLAKLCEMSASLATVFEPRAILNQAAEVVMQAVPADCCAALMTDQKGEPKLVTLKFRDVESGRLSQPLISRTAVRTAIEKRALVSSQDVLGDASFKGSQSAILQNIQSLACAPLLGRSGVYGALYVDRRHALETFSELDVQLLAAIAAQAAIAVEAAKAHETAQRDTLARAAFARFMPEHIIKELVENPEKFKLGGTNKRISVLFCDVRGFARLCHQARPETIVDLLNILFTEMCEEIFERQGTLNKYIGDGLMALFGAPLSAERDAVNAVAASIGMQRRIKKVNSQLVAKNLPPVTLGIGINTGEATIGCIGAEQRSEYTAIGDTVNIASRIEGVAKPGQILITRSTMKEVGNEFPLSNPWLVEVKNINEPVEVYSVEYGTL